MTESMTTKTTPSNKSVTLRGRPQQARSRETFDAILRAAAVLLEEVGWDGFNTNLLSERAGYRVSAIYRYFPNKMAIVTALAETVIEEWEALFSDFDERIAEHGDIRIVWKIYLERFMATLRDNPGSSAILRAMQASPELRAIDQESLRRVSVEFGRKVATHIPDLTRERAISISRLILQTALSTIELAQESSPDEAERLLSELEAMHIAYYDQLGAPGTRSN